MKKTIKLVALFVVLCMVSTFVFAACNKAEKETLKTYVLPENETLLDDDFTLPASIGYGENALEVTWTSSNTDRIAIGEKTEDGYPAVVTLADGDVVEVTLTLSVVGTKLTKDFNVRVDCYDVYRFLDNYTFKMQNKTTYEPFNLDQKVTFKGKEVAIKWSVEDTASKAVISVSEDNKKCNVNAVEADTPVKIRASFTYNDETTFRDFAFTVIPVPSTMTFFDPITTPAAGDYVFGVNQMNIQKYLFAKAEITNSKYLATTTDPAEAAKATLAKSGDNWTIQLDGKFVELSEGKVVLNDAQTTGFVWTWNADAKTFTAPSGDKTYYLGCYSTYDTIGASETKYITGDNAKNLDVTQHPARLGQAEICEVGSFRAIKTPAAAEDLVFGVHQGNIDKWLYAKAEITNTKYLATTTDATQAAKAKLAASGDGWTIQLDGKFVELANGIVVLNDAQTTGFVWTWNADAKTFTAPSGDKTYYLGCYSTYDTIGASETKYITGDNAKNLDVTQHPARLGTPVLSPVVDNGSELPSASLAATADFSKGSNSTVTKEGTYTDYQGNSATGGIQKTASANGITVTNDIGTSTSAVTSANDSKALRLYAGSNVTISYTSAIKYIVLTCESGKATLGKIEATGFKVIEDSKNSTITIVLDTPATSVTLTGIAAQIRVTSIEVYC